MERSGISKSRTLPFWKKKLYERKILFCVGRNPLNYLPLAIQRLANVDRNKPSLNVKTVFVIPICVPPSQRLAVHVLTEAQCSAVCSRNATGIPVCSRTTPGLIIEIPVR